MNTRRHTTDKPRPIWIILLFPKNTHSQNEETKKPSRYIQNSHSMIQMTYIIVRSMLETISRWSITCSAKNSCKLIIYRKSLLWTKQNFCFCRRHPVVCLYEYDYRAPSHAIACWWGFHNGLGSRSHTYFWWIILLQCMLAFFNQCCTNSLPAWHYNCVYKATEVVCILVYTHEIETPHT